MYRSASVDVWVRDGRIAQIMVHGAYRGHLPGQVGLGMPLHEVRARLGDTCLDDEDNVVVQAIAGVCIEYDVDSPVSELTEIYIFDPATG